MVNVCHITSVHPIEDIRIFHKECVSLAKNGFNVTLIACGDTAYDKVKAGVRLVSLEVPVKNRVQRMFKRTRAVYKAAIEMDADIYHLHDPELILIGLLLKKRGAKIIFDSHEDVPALILSKIWIPGFLRRVISWLYGFIEVKLLKKYNALISVTPTLTNRLKNINKNTYQITNYPIIDDKMLSIKPSFNKDISFAGGVNAQWNHRTVLDALKETNEIKYNLAGYIDNNYFDELMVHSAWEKVNYVGEISHREVGNFLSNSSVGMALCSYSPNVGGKIGSLGNTKLFEYMMVGLPVICTDFDLWKEIVENNDCGICVNPYNKEEVLYAINKIVENSERAKQMGENGRNLVKSTYNWNSQEKILLRLYSELNN